MDNYVLGTDTWEGNPDLDEPVLWDGGVRLHIIRLNSISGGLHKDDTFDQQWAESERFYRVPYYVYNPWASWVDNVDWLCDPLYANLPAGVKRVCIDVEVKRSGYTPQQYAADLEHFINAVKRDYNVTIYTGQWFVPLLAYWPKTVDYWWARYPYSWYPPVGQQVTWADIHAKIRTTTWSPCCSLGTCLLWQCSGDRMKPPGCDGHAVDINIWNGTEDELAQWVGRDAPPPPATWAESIDAWARSMGYAGPKP